MPVRETAIRYFEAISRRGQPRSRYGGASVQNVEMSGYAEIAQMLSLISASPIRTAIESFYGENVAIPLNHALLRYYYAAESQYGHISPFHQDLVGIDARARVTSWWPLDRCGVNAPGLEILDVKLDSLVPVDADGADKEFGISADRLIAQFGDRLIHPEFEPGDVALFLNTTPHRTFVTSDMDQERYSFECRYMPATLLKPHETEPGFYPLAGKLSPSWL